VWLSRCAPAGDPGSRVSLIARRSRWLRRPFAIERIIEFDCPKEWPQSGFQLGAILWTRGYDGSVMVETLTEKA
jgi:hypothetical protein